MSPVLADRPVRLRLVDDGLDQAQRRHVAAEIAEIVAQARLIPAFASVPYAPGAPDIPPPQGPAVPRIEGRVVGHQVNPEDPTELALLLEDGRTVKTKLGKPTRAVARDEVMATQAKALRQPAKVNIRPGNSGQRRRPGRDRSAGLEQYGEISWQSAPGGARVGTMLLDPNGNTVICCRVSAEDRDQLLVQHFEGPWALCQAHEELVPRLAIFAVNMRGARTVRPDGAGPPPPGTLEREDMLLLDSALHAGWVEHIVSRDADRIARDTLPGETLLRRWENARASLWLSTYGRKMSYQSDWITLRMMMLGATMARVDGNARLRRGALTRGPLAGRGHLGPKPYGMVRDAEGYLEGEPEGMRWVRRLFEIAVSGEASNKRGGLSIREVARIAAAEGCPISAARVARILRDPIYSEEGDWYATVGEQELLQRKPHNPYAVDNRTFALVQQLLPVRKGASKNTRTGECAYNTVHCFHVQCGGRIAGYRLANSTDLLRYRHRDGTPEPCKHMGANNRGLTWNRSNLEPPLFAALRNLVDEPEVARQLAEATRHEEALTTGLSDHERAELEDELSALEDQLDAAADAYVLQARTEEISVEGFQRITEALTRRRDQVKRRLDNDAAAKANAPDDSLLLTEDRKELFLALMTDEPPEDELHMCLRARILQTVVSRIEIDDDGSGPITITAYGRLVPEDASAEVCNPVAASAHILDEVVRAGIAAEFGRPRAKGGEVETVSLGSTDKTVSRCHPALSGLPAGPVERPSPKRATAIGLGIEAAMSASSQQVLRQRYRQKVTSTTWVKGRSWRPRHTRPSWVLSLTVEREPLRGTGAHRELASKRPTAARGSAATHDTASPAKSERTPSTT